MAANLLVWKKRCGTIACGKGYNLEGVHEKSQPFLYDGGCQINVLPACSILFDCYNRTLFIQCPGKTKVIEKGDSPCLQYSSLRHILPSIWEWMEDIFESQIPRCRFCG